MLRLSSLFFIASFVLIVSCSKQQEVGEMPELKPTKIVQSGLNEAKKNLDRPPLKNSKVLIAKGDEIITSGYHIIKPTEFEQNESSDGQTLVFAPSATKNTKEIDWKIVQVIHIPNKENISLDSMVSLNLPEATAKNKLDLKNAIAIKWKTGKFKLTANDTLFRETYFIRKNNLEGEIYRIEIGYKKGDTAETINRMRRCAESFMYSNSEVKIGEEVKKNR